MSKRYIELYSGHRNRTRFPLSSCYDVPFYSTRQILYGSHSTDPICTGSIYYTWTGTNPISSPLTANAGTVNGNILLSSASFSSITNYYIGYHINSVNSMNVIIEQRVIKSYNASNGSFIPDIAFVNPVAGIKFTITDPSNPSLIYIPSTDLNGLSLLIFPEAYDGYYIIDETLSLSGGPIIYRKIIDYNFQTQTATLETPFPTTGTNVWSPTDTYTLRKTVPYEKYILDTVNTTPFYTMISLPVSQGNFAKNYYLGKYVYHSYNQQISPNTYPNPLVNKNINGGGTYGLYYINSSQYNDTSGRVELIIYYDTNTVYNGNNIPNYDISTGLGAAINIVTYIYDNFSPLNYNGSVVSQNETVCYEVSLTSLILPNIPLISGSRLVFYPFIYVEFGNMTSPSGSSNDIIYSNNPESGKALFICPISDTSHPINSKFMKISSNMVQTIKFKPNDSLRFSVYLPNGELFQTVETDYLSPYPANQLLQISAVFGIRRI